MLPDYTEMLESKLQTLAHHMYVLPLFVRGGSVAGLPSRPVAGRHAPAAAVVVDRVHLLLPRDGGQLGGVPLVGVHHRAPPRHAREEGGGQHAMV